MVNVLPINYMKSNERDGLFKPVTHKNRFLVLCYNSLVKVIWMIPLNLPVMENAPFDSWRFDVWGVIIFVLLFLLLKLKINGTFIFEML